MELLNFIGSNPIWSAILSGSLMYGAALLGAMLMYFFAARNGLDGTVPKLQQLFPGKGETFYFRCDFLMVIIIGPIVGLICFRPNDTFQALAAGCGWVGALNVLIQQKPTIRQDLPTPPNGGPNNG